MTAPPLFAGLDVSTQGCKLVVIEPATARVVHVDRVDYDTDLPHWGTRDGVVPGLGAGVSESDPRMWVEAVEVLLGRLAGTGAPARRRTVDGVRSPLPAPRSPLASRIRCIAVSGQMHGLVALAVDGTLARPRAKLWNDFSTAEECRVLTEAVGGLAAMLAEVGNSQRTGYTAPKILHLVRHEPASYARAATLFVVHNYINWWLTGGPDGGVAALEPGDASGMALWHPGSERWSRAVMDAIAPDLATRLPALLPSDRTIGTVGGHLVAQYGFDPACRVDAGCGDNMYGAVGTGNVEPGIVTVSLGTSGTACTVLDEPYLDPTGEIAAYRDSTGRHFPLLCVSNMANVYDGMLARLGLTHAAFDAAVERVRPGAGGAVLVPWYAGERTPDIPHASPVAFGFDPDRAAPDLLCRLVVEGCLLNLYDGYARMPVQARQIRLTGGLASSPAWCQAVADIFDTETVPVEGEGAALGAAVHAAWVWERERGAAATLAETAMPFVAFAEQRRSRPRPAHAGTYALLRRLFRAVSRSARGVPGEDPHDLQRALTGAAG